MKFEVTLRFRVEAGDMDLYKARTELLPALVEDVQALFDYEVTWVGDDIQQLSRMTMEPATPQGIADAVFANERARDREQAKYEIENDLDQGISFTGTMGGITHPWDQGLWIFPEGHPLRKVEEDAKAGNEQAHRILDETLEIAEEFKQLPRGQE